VLELRVMTAAEEIVAAPLVASMHHHLTVINRPCTIFPYTVNAPYRGWKRGRQPVRPVHPGRIGDASVSVTRRSYS